LHRSDQPGAAHPETRRREATRHGAPDHPRTTASARASATCAGHRSVTRRRCRTRRASRAGRP